MPTRAQELVEVLGLIEDRLDDLSASVAAIRTHIEGNPEAIPESGGIVLPGNPFPIPEPLPKLTGGRCFMPGDGPDLHAPELRDVTEALGNSCLNLRDALVAVGLWRNGDPMSGGSNG